MAKNRSPIEVRNSGIAYQLRQSGRLPFVFSNAIFNGLWILLVWWDGMRDSMRDARMVAAPVNICSTSTAPTTVRSFSARGNG